MSRAWAQFVSDTWNRQRQTGRVLQDEETAKVYVLLEVQECIDRRNGRSLDLNGLPSPPQNLAPLDEPQKKGENAFETVLLDAVKAVAKFSMDQGIVCDAVVGALLPGATCPNLQEVETSTEQEISPRLFLSQQGQFFIDASGGTGRTFVVNALLNFLMTKRKGVIAVATSAVATQLLCKSRTEHSTFRVPIPCKENSTCLIDVS